MTELPSVRLLLSEEQLSQIRGKSDLWGAWLVLHAWSLIIGSAFLVVLYPSFLTYALAVIIIGSRQLGLLILMHDSAHGALFRSPRLNFWVGQLACAFPMFADVAIYREYHIRHHLHTQKPEDPDIGLTNDYPISKKSLLRKFIRDLTGQTAFHQRAQQLSIAFGSSKMPYKKRAEQFRRSMGKQLICNAIIFLIASYLGYASLYFWLWIVPLMTWHQLVIRIRNIAEHAAVGSSEDRFRNTRTTVARFWERLLIAPYWVNYHLEHHLVMWVPCYRLLRLHQFLLQNGFGTRMEIEYGYIKLLKKVTHSNSDNDDSGKKSRSIGTFSDGFKTE